MAAAVQREFVLQNAKQVLKATKKSGIARGSFRLIPGSDCSQCPRKSGTKLEFLSSFGAASARLDLPGP